MPLESATPEVYKDKGYRIAFGATTRDEPYGRREEIQVCSSGERESSVPNAAASGRPARRAADAARTLTEPLTVPRAARPFPPPHWPPVVPHAPARAARAVP